MSYKPLHHLQNVLRKKGVKRLTGHYHIKVNIHSKYKNLYQFKYNQIESPMGSKVVQACRGIILDRDNDWAPVCHTYDKFFNLGEGHAADIDWHTARVYEKLDGSLMQLYHYDGQWHVATSGTPDADCDVPFGNMTFKDLFWKTWNDLGYELPKDTSYCYAFELMTPYNYVIVRYEESRLVFHGQRNLERGYEEHPWTLLNWDVVERHDLYHTDEIFQMLESMNGSEQEGFIVVDDSFNRVKMKCDDYVRKHRLVSSLSQRNILDLVRNKEGSEFLVYFPEWQDLYDEMKRKVNGLAVEIENEYNKIKNIKNQKDFAMKAKGSRYSGILFNLRNGKTETVKESFANMHIKNLEGLLGLK